MRATFADWLRHRLYALTAAGLLLALLLVAALRGPDLFTGSGLTVACAVAAPIVLGTMALTPVAIAGRGGVDLAVGPLLCFVNVVLVQWLFAAGVDSALLVVPLAIALGVVVEAIQGTLVAVLRIQPVIVTLGGFLILSGLDLTILPQTGGTAPAWVSGLADTVAGVPAAALVVAGACAAWMLIARSTFFANVRLVGADERAAYTAGIDLVAARIGAYAVGGVFAGLGGLMFTALIGSGDPTQGSTYTLTALTALVLGGTSLAGGRGGMLGSVVAAIDVYLITYILSTFDFGKNQSYVGQVTYGLVLVGSLMLGATLIARLTPQVAA
jgi:ribose transport system permease protein